MYFLLRVSCVVCWENYDLTVLLEKFPADYKAPGLNGKDPRAWLIRAPDYEDKGILQTYKNIWKEVSFKRTSCWSSQAERNQNREDINNNNLYLANEVNNLQ